ncbi:metallophosphoesterase [Methanonatronarchaeum sp. AMET6-2]|uniref:metallophosphoesterase n=1 Tax=Methanonatronarchaeum sp. AMET6-2 TaxID=2933293 RepID=UPI001225EE88|nr:metallophosphoesterase [Methanonatronarchaeum sp. AMET6-2]RZN63061.1 MAG: metallophosphoesterase [Methanonatronarchaeia archaeon]UOY09605.1 metallophosphoesterase [Methanonatronarchaeum sp. AMET6-2]
MGLVNPVPEEPAALVDGCLVVSDLHIGVEASYRDRGVMIPSQTDKLLSRLKKLVGRVDPECLLVLGDLKHNVAGSSWQERDEIPGFLEALNDIVSVYVVPGNHDGHIDRLVPDEVCVLDNRGVVHGRVGLVHGHTWPSSTVMSVKRLLIGHNHPVIKLRDSLGRVQRKKAWIRSTVNQSKLVDRYPGGMVEKIVIMPAYNELVGGVAFNEPDENYLGPLFKQGLIESDKLKGHLLDGTYLGPLNNIMDDEYMDDE